MRFLATEPHYADHLRPVHEAVAEMTGQAPPFLDRAPRRGRPGAERRELTVVASEADRRRVPAPVARMEHGVGMSYVTKGARPASYPGGAGQRNVAAFISPNEYAAREWRRRYPGKPAPVVGIPRLDHLARLKAKPMPDRPTVCVSFHWDCLIAPETRWGWPHFGEAALALAGDEEFDLVGHSHPRAAGWIRPAFEGAGVEYLGTFDEVLRRADVYVVDNSSTLYEFAAADRPVVMLNPPWYRRAAAHGLRFWEHSDVGEAVWDPGQLAGAVRRAILEPTEHREARRAATLAVAPHMGQAASRAAEALVQLEASGLE